ncbi:HrpD5 family protein [Paracidovorax valerianellae]|uniref:Type III secretion protein D n=1 Tax=Paracidovorax valerianellae TaxID=187868 RepID=A0A1G6Z894_9BURK|nr:HrpD5 family protein [Paracidovorax valerianellae]MDA8445702.1 secretion protein [Paracidovorax valerianellae]SDD98105.1 type III secretion protein D [Paracidovorax valerianellae]
MKQLRILTGQHAGAQINLTSTRYLVSAEDAADIQLTDWTSEAMLIEAGEDGMIQFALSPHGEAKASLPMEDFVPHRMGDIVLCTGPGDAAWPASVDLIARLGQVTMAAAPKGRKVSPMVLSAVVGTALMTAALSAAVAPLSPPSRDRAATGAANQEQPPQEPLLVRVQRALAAAPISGLEVIPQADGVTVRGLLADSSDADTVRQLLAPFKRERVVHAYATATEVEQSIADAIARPGVRIHHLGEGRFNVTGDTQNLAALKDSATRIAADLAPLVKRIEVSASELPPAGVKRMSALMNTGDLQYVQTRDGVKHLSPPNAEALAANDWSISR